MFYPWPNLCKTVKSFSCIKYLSASMTLIVSSNATSYVLSLYVFTTESRGKKNSVYVSIHWPMFQIYSYIRSSLSYPQFTLCHCTSIFTIDSMHSFIPNLRYSSFLLLIDRSKQINDVCYRRLDSWKSNVRNNPIWCHCSLNIK